MKKVIKTMQLFFAITIFPMLYSCNMNSDIAHSTKQYNYGQIEIIEVDSCEYILFRDAYKGGICHKENCKFCNARDTTYHHN